MGFAEIAAMAGGHAEARAIQIALKLGMFEALSHGRLDEAAMARAMNTDPRATGLLANALTALGLLEKTDALFALNESSRRYLLRDSDEYLGAMILFDAALWDVWGRLEDSIRSGKSARTPDMFQNSPEDAARFIRAMDSLVRARGDAAWVADHLDLRKIVTIADLGGGPGTYITAMLKRWPHLRAAIWDLPATLTVAREVLAERESTVHDRLDLLTVDYLKGSLPQGVDAIFMSNIIHSEDEATNAELMKKCFLALNPGGMLIVKDHVMNRELTSPTAGAVFAIYLLLTTKGRDFSFDEVCWWLREAGFNGIEEHALPSPPFTSSMVIAHKL